MNRLLTMLPALLLSGLIPTTSLNAADLPAAPLLRIETGMHTAVIKRIGVDKAGRWLVSASEDKTVRVWDISAGLKDNAKGLTERMVPTRVLRPPVGDGDEGKLYAVAISPDGNLVAAGGFTGGDGESHTSIYLFNRGDGRMMGRFSGRFNVVNHLTFSPNGRWLAASLGGESGLRIFAVDADAKPGDSDKPALRLVAQDGRYRDSSYGNHFSPDSSRLVTSCYDKYLRLYSLADLGEPGRESISLRPLLKQRAPGGRQPGSVRFSPDGASIAVAYTDTGNIDVMSAADFTLLYAPDTGKVEYGHFTHVAWSPDGKELYGAGSADTTVKGAIRRWSDAGKGSYLDLKSGVSNVITDLIELPDGGVSFCAGDPAIGVLTRDGAQQLLLASEVADYRAFSNGLAHFKSSPDGTVIQFYYDAKEKKYATFSPTSRILSLKEGPLTLAPPDTTSLPVKGWEDDKDPTLHGRSLKLSKHEYSRTLAIAPDKASFLLGTGWSLRRYDSKGEQQWEIPVPGSAWVANITPNGAIAIAAFGDGTIRWYRYADGVELLAFFPHSDRKRWVVWTPSGYYDASPGAEDLFGWHINGATDKEADFFPASRFRDTRYRPDLIARILQTGDEAEALRLADAERGSSEKVVAIAQALPPTVRITAPTGSVVVSETTLLLRYTVRATADAPAESIRVMIDGRPVATFAAASSAKEQSLTISIPERDCLVSIIASNRHAASVPDSVRVSWKGKAREPVARTAIAMKARPDLGQQVKPRLFLLAVGVSDYADKKLELKFAAKDAKDFAQTQLAQKDQVYSEVHLKLLPDAILNDIKDGLQWLEEQVTAGDVGMIFLAGHGVNDQANSYYFLPKDADLAKLKRSGLEFSTIKTTLSSLKGKALLFLDTCHSGNMTGGKKSLWDMTKMVNELGSDERGVVVFASSTGNQYSYEDERWNNGAFTKALVEGITGKADFMKKGRVTFTMLDLYVSERVKELTGEKQTPGTIKPALVADFLLALNL